MAHIASFRDSSRLARQLSLAVAATAVLICFSLLLRGPWRLNAEDAYFFKAQQYQARGLDDLALKHYQLFTKVHPQSPYAPAALKAQADIITEMARKNGDGAQFQEAINLYRQLADNYTGDRNSGDALLLAAAIAKDDLNDAAQAHEILNQIVERFPNNAGYLSQATVRLGRLALETGKGDEAKTLLQSVLQKFPRLVEACAEAQYHLGVLYETVFKKKGAAEDAYNATIEHYGRSVWASSAKERLGLLIFHSADKHPERLVLIEVQPVPDDGDGDNGILEALRPLLAARGLNFDPSTLRGWSLEPFWGAFDPNRPGRSVAAPFSAFNNVASNANLLFDRRQSVDEKSALSALQRELDASRPVMIYNGAWRLVVGYDSEHQEIFVQSRGARVQAIPVKEFLTDWKRKAPDGGPFTLMTFYAPGEKARLSRVDATKAKTATGSIVRGTENPDATPTLPTINPAVPDPTPTPVPTPVSLGLTPTYVFQLKPLSSPDAHRRALRRAVTLMRRARVGTNDTALLNLDALDAVATALERVAKAPATSVGAVEPVLPVAPASPVPLPEGDQTEAVPTETGAAPADAKATPLPTATATATPVFTGTQKLERTRQLAQWFGGPLQNWVTARRDAAAYLQAAAGPLRRAQLKQAAENLRLSVSELSSAAAAMPTANSLDENGELSDSARRALLEAARHIRAARAAEARATDQMDF